MCEKLKRKIINCFVLWVFFMFSFLYAVFRSETAEKWFWKSCCCWRGNLSFWYQFRVCLAFLLFRKEGSLNNNSWERGFGNRVKFFRLLFQFNTKSLEKFSSCSLGREIISKRGVLRAFCVRYAAYKNTTGDNKIFKVVFNGDGKSKQSWLTFGFL